MAKPDVNWDFTELDHGQLEKIAWIAERTKFALTTGMSALQRLNQITDDATQLDAISPELDGALNASLQEIRAMLGENSSTANALEPEARAQLVREKLGQLILAWDDIQRRVNALLRERDPEVSLCAQAKELPN
ncbi:hypothetical protein [Magnetofaba australis]|uniref:Uncharacterized protein n=1 Tax=Magnetofaba australis IT-1 TaxID=1434232 RepID=A0A1Y2K2L7_9PROT|nr:hypothetical protein [Magnetofaba australis]OSM02278.1 hypothetical protein MAIT1_02398 [Magnetofaba australis IT-1]